MKVLLLNPPKTLAVQPPLGLLYVAAFLERSGVNVKAIDCSIEGIGFDRLPELIRSEKPDIVGVTACTPSITYALNVLKIAKEAVPSVKTVIGGPHPSAVPDTIKEDCVDFLVCGEGELTMLELVRALEGMGDLRKVDGLSFKDGGKVVVNGPRKFIENLDSLPWPARHFVPIVKYPSILLPLKVPETSIMGSRGCPFRCTFCSKAVFGRHTRLRDPKKVVDEIEHLYKTYNVKGIFFYDDSFNFNTKWVGELCDEIIRRGLNHLTYKGEVRVNKLCVSKELMEKMRKAGFYLLAFGVESGNQEILNRLKKDITTEEVRNAVKLAKDAGIWTYGFFMTGNSGDTPQTIKETVGFAKSAGFDFVQFGISQPYPGTEFYLEAKEKGWLKARSWEDYMEDKRATLVEMPGLPTEYLKKINSWAIRSFYFRPAYVLRMVPRALSSLKNLKFTISGLKWVLKAS